MRSYNARVVAAVILAAGSSSRMGRDKGLLPVPGGGTFLSRLTRSLLEGGCAEVVAVVGAAERAFQLVVERECLPGPTRPESRPVARPALVAS